MIDLNLVAALLILLAICFLLYTYFLYPLLLWLISRLRPNEFPEPARREEWPAVSISVSAFNEEAQIGGLIESLLDLDYPRDRLQILIVSDGSDDRTDEIVRGFEDEGVELIRMPERGGKTKAEAAALGALRGELVVNMDASTRVPSGSLKELITPFSDPSVGLASGRDVSVALDGSRENLGESGYVGYEMAIRDLETRVSGIVGASGCFYAIRKDLHRVPLPDHLSRDFAAALHTRERGFRAVSAPRAVCFVPRTTSLRREFQRKTRTIARGMDTLAYKRNLLNPFHFGLFSWMLFSHKICRWLLPWFGLGALIGLGVLAFANALVLILFLAGLVFLLLGGLGWVAGSEGEMPRVLALPGYLVLGNLAAVVALVRFLKRERNAIWEPTRRDPVG
jgi:cellulose synthase/poly-beta-1,6-N-acetylglucosamine synthase-like glycosyltransferase